MIPIKIQCGCGQKYSFEVEPRAGRIDNAVQCPACGADGTTATNQLIAQHLAAQSDGNALLETPRGLRVTRVVAPLGGIVALVVLLAGAAWFHASGRDQKNTAASPAQV